MGWESAKQAADESGGGLFVRLSDDKDSFIGVFLGEPETRRQVYDEATSKYHDITDEEVKKGIKPRVSFSMNVFVLDAPKDAKGKPEGKKATAGELKIYGMNSATFKDLFVCKEKYGTDKWAIEVTRNGKKKDTKTTYTVLPDHEITPPIAALIAGIEKLHNLTGKDPEDEETDMASHKKEGAAAPKTNRAAATASKAVDEPIDEATRVQIIDRLKPHPQDKIVALLATMKVTKVRELKSSQLPAMLAGLDALDGKGAAAAADSEDPFA